MSEEFFRKVNISGSILSHNGVIIFMVAKFSGGQNFQRFHISMGNIIRDSIP